MTLGVRVSHLKGVSMKQGKSLSELAAELEHHSSKRDFIVDTRELELVPRLMIRENDQPLCLPESLS